MSKIDLELHTELLSNETREGCWNVEKRSDSASLSFLKDVYIERGTLDDWRLLENLHYKNHGSITPGSHYFRMVLGDEVIGVLMMASPKLLLKERHVAFPKLKPGNDSRLTNTMRMKWINANMSIVARCVVDTMYRGAGLAYRFANIASRMEGKRFIEIQSSMSKFNQFAQKAGFHFVKPMRSTKFDVGIRFMTSTFDSDPADLEAILKEIEAMPEEVREKVLDNVRTFYRKHSMMESTGKALIETNGVKFGDSRVSRLPVRELIYQLQQMILASPLYGVYKNPDAGRDDLPGRIPVLAFDNQPVDKKLVLK